MASVPSLPDPPSSSSSPSSASSSSSSASPRPSVLTSPGAAEGLVGRYSRRVELPERTQEYFDQSWWKQLATRERTGDPESDARADSFNFWATAGVALFALGSFGSLFSAYIRARAPAGARRATRTAAEARAALAAQAAAVRSETLAPALRAVPVPALAPAVADAHPTAISLANADADRLQDLLVRWQDLYDRHRARNPHVYAFHEDDDEDGGHERAHGDERR